MVDSAEGFSLGGCLHCADGSHAQGPHGCLPQHLHGGEGVVILLQRCRQLDACIKISPGRYTVSVHCLNCLCPIIQRSCRTYRDVGPCSWTLLARAYDLQHDSRAADRSSDLSQGSISTRGKGIKVLVVIPLLFPDNHPSSSSSLANWKQLSRDTTTSIRVLHYHHWL